MWEENNKPSIASNGNDTTHKNGKIGDGFWHCFTNINIYLVIVILELRPWFEMDGNLDLEFHGLCHSHVRIQQFFLTCIEFGKFPLTALLPC